MQPRAEEAPLLPIDSILHPTDFSQASELAFFHALAIALAARAELTLLHVGADREGPHWSSYPGVRAALERWGLLAPGSPRDAVPRLGIDVDKVWVPGTDPARSILGFLKERPAQLIVLATHGREGLPRFLESAVAEPLARGSGAMTLFLPHDARPFVSPDNGLVSLRSVVVPVAQQPSPQVAVSAAATLAGALGAAGARFSLVYVGAPGEMPVPRLPAGAAPWERVVRAGDPAQMILECVSERSADLVVMATAGHHGFLDALRGSTTEQVVRRAACPVLAVPGR